jgi:DNA-binding NtrC family response regulator
MRAKPHYSRAADKSDNNHVDHYPGMIAASPVMRHALHLIHAATLSDANVLITGESGTGKEVAARIIHDDSARGASAFVAVNLSALSAGVFESELFGHVKGAFTDAKADFTGRFERAHGGTLFLDEIATTPGNFQSKLLRVLETRLIEPVGSSKVVSIDIRLISATSGDLTSEVRSGNFRKDLFFRLKTIHVDLPPLRERKQDIPLLVNHFLKAHCARYRRDLSIPLSTMQLLLDYDWPGNVREVDHVIESAVITAAGNEIQAFDLSLCHDWLRSEDWNLENARAAMVEQAVERFGGNFSRAAEALGISRSSLYRRVQRVSSGKS